MYRKLLVILVFFWLPVRFIAADTVFLKNGNVLRGEVRSFENGRFTLYLDQARGDQPSEIFVRVNDVARISFERQAAPNELREVPHVLDVVSTQPISSTGIQVRQGDRIRIEAGGEIYVDRTRRTGPNGLVSGSADKPLTRENWGALYAMVGNFPAEALVVGTRREFTARRDGEIFLGINDGFLANNSGTYSVTVTTWEPFGSADAQSPIPRRESGASEQSMQIEDRLEVRSDLDWTDTGIDVIQGERIQLQASGNIYIAPNRPSGPGGVAPGILGAIFGTLPMPNAGQGALIGQIRGEKNSDLFVIGSRADVVAPLTGKLYLGINDGDISDNSGSFMVTIRHRRPGRRF
ncbi:MAG TPA: hypothetical protein VGL91_15655 [Acidobacteriota bacterium]